MNRPIALAEARPVAPAAGLATLLLALGTASPAFALNKLVNSGFEDAATAEAAGWTEAPFSGNATENGFGVVSSGAGQSSFVGDWSAGANNKTASRAIYQEITLPADAYVKLRARYQRTGSGAVVSSNLTFRLYAVSAPTVTIASQTVQASGPGNDTTFVSTGWTTPDQRLTAGVRYRVEVSWSVSLDNNGRQAIAVDDVQLQTSPLYLTVAPVADSPDVILTWPASTGTPGLRGTQSYALYRGTASGSLSQLALLVPASYTDTGTSANTRYFYALGDYDTAGSDSPLSVEQQVLTLPAAPGKPSFGSVTASSITVNWTAPSGGAGTYRLERAPDSGGSPGTFTEIASGIGALSYADGSVSCATTYYYRVRATNASGDGPYSQTNNKTTSACPTIAIANVNDPPAANACPGDTKPADNFSLKTSSGTATVTSLSVELPAGMQLAVSQLEVFTPSNGTVVASASNPTDALVRMDGLNIQVGNTAVTYRVRLSFKGQAELAPGTYPVNARVAGLEAAGFVAADNDTAGNTITVANSAPAEATWLSANPLDGQVSLSWSMPTGAGYSVLVRGLSPVALSLTDGASYSVGQDLGSGVTVVYAGNANAATDTGLTNGTAYHYKLFTRDGCLNFSAGVRHDPVTPVGSTMVGESTDPGDASICPGGAPAAVDRFILATASGSDIVERIQVQLSSGAAGAVGRLEIFGPGNVALGSVVNPPSDLVDVDVSPIAVNATASGPYEIRITPRADAALPAGITEVRATVEGLTCTNPVTSNDTASSALRIDNEAPSAPTWQAPAIGDARLDLAWSAATGASSYLVLRSESAISFTPAEGTNYTAGQTLQNAAVTVAYVGTALAFTDEPLLNDHSYYYELFALDGCANYSSGTAAGPIAPIRPVTTIGDGALLTDAEACPGETAVDVGSFSLQTNRGSDSIWQIVIQLGAGSAPGVEKLQVLGDDGVTLHGEQIRPATDRVEMTLTRPLQADSSGPHGYRIRITPRSHANMPVPPGGLYAISARLIELVSNNQVAGSDPSSATLLVDNESPEPPAWGLVVPGEATLTLHWSAPGSASVLVLRGTHEITAAPREGTQYSTGLIDGTEIAYVGAGDSFDDTGLSDSIGYYYAAFAMDSCGNYSIAASTGPHQPGEPATFLSEGPDPADATGVCPGAGPLFADAFSLSTNVGEDAVSELQIELSAGSAALIGLLEVTDQNGNVVYGSAQNPSTDSLSLALATPLPVGPQPRVFKIRLTPKTHAQMPAVPGSRVQISCRVGAVTGHNQTSGQDPGSALIDIDNESPPAPSWLGAEGDATLSLSWSNPEVDDLAGALLLRTSGSAAESPDEGASYEVGDAVGTGSVVFSGDGAAAQDTPPAGSVYRLFARDRCGNYSTAAELRPGEPDTDGGIGPSQEFGAYDLGGCGCSQAGPAPLAALIVAGLLLALPRRRRE